VLAPERERESLQILIDQEVLPPGANLRYKLFTLINPCLISQMTNSILGYKKNTVEFAATVRLKVFPDYHGTWNHK